MELLSLDPGYTLQPHICSKPWLSTFKNDLMFPHFPDSTLLNSLQTALPSSLIPNTPACTLVQPPCSSNEPDAGLLRAFASVVPFAWGDLHVSLFCFLLYPQNSE